MALLDELQRKKGLGSLLPGKGGERIKPLPPGFKRERFLQQPPPRPRITEPGGPRPPRPPGESIQAKIDALKMQKLQLQMQIAKIDSQIQRLLGQETRPPWEDIGFGPEGPPPPTRPILPWDPQPIGPPTMPGPPSIGPIGPPTMPGPGTPPPSIGPISPPSIGPGTPIPQPPTQPPWQPEPPPWGG